MGAVSHDLRTPLTVIKAAVENLRDPSIELDPTARGELLQFVEEQSDRLERLVVNILDMTRIRAGALTPRIAPVPVATLLAEALASLPPGIGRRVVSHLGVDDPVVAADHVLISQVLANYLDNADRHTQDASVIEVSARTLEASVEVRVVDHGPGVAPGDRDRIFDMFSRVSGAGRAGLGLAIAKAFVEAHGGVVGVADAPGGGACFTFTIARAA
jgi:two-component system sensor histidine kinase KdpD